MFSVIKRNPTLSFRDIRRVLIPQCKDLDAPEPGAFSYTGYARFALYNVLRLLKLKHGSEVLLPAYICDVMVLPFAKLGLKPVYYGITDRFQIDFSTVRLTPSTKAIITVNYFGMSQNFDVIKSFVCDHQLIWINDNSHGFASSHGESKLETFGDFSITSFRKVLPTINGARARINNEAYGYMGAELAALNRPNAVEGRLLRFLGSTLLGNLHYRPWRHPDYSVMYASPDSDIMPFRLDRISGQILSITAEERVQKRRFRLYRAVDSFLSQRHYQFLESIPGLLQAGNSPMAYPVMVSDQDCWSAILRVSRDLGVNIYTWPDMPQEVVANNLFGTVDQWQKLLFLPIQQDIDAEKYCARLAEVLNSV